MFNVFNGLDEMVDDFSFVKSLIVPDGHEFCGTVVLFCDGNVFLSCLVLVLVLIIVRLFIGLCDVIILGVVVLF